MQQTIDRLLALRVDDVMSSPAVTVDANQSMVEVARIFREHDVSSVPVLNDLGHCVGILSATDFVRREADLSSSAGERAATWKSAGVDGPHTLSSEADDYARDHMTSAVQSIDPGASLLKAARMMCAEHIHRLLVIDESQHVLGVISTMDIVAAVVNAVDELSTE